MIIKGRYIPLFAAEILDHNAKAIAGGLTPINLQSIAIGNGMINAGEMFPTLWDVGCTSVVIEPFMSIADCVEMKRGVRVSSLVSPSAWVLTYTP